MANIDYIFQGVPPTGTGSGAIVAPGSAQYPSIGLDTLNGTSYVSMGNGWVPLLGSVVTKLDLLAQAAAISATTFYTVPANMAGLYKIDWEAKVTTVASTGAGTSTLTGSTGVVFTYTDKDDSTIPSTVGVAGSAGNLTTTMLSGAATVNAKAASVIQYAVGYTSDTAAQMKYSFHLRLKYLG